MPTFHSQSRGKTRDGEPASPPLTPNFLYSQFFLRKNNNVIDEEITINPTANQNPYFHSNSAVLLKFMP
jgi:hypothetical protein